MKDGKIKVLICEIWDLSGYSENRKTFKRPTCQKLAFRDKLSLRY